MSYPSDDSRELKIARRSDVPGDSRSFGHLRMAIKITG